MLLRIFASLGAAGAVLNALLANHGYGGAKLAGFMLLRFAEYFVAAHLAYAVLMLAGTEAFVRFDKPQEKPSKFWQWHLREVANMLCFYGRMDVKVSGREKLPGDSRYLMVCNHRSYFDPITMVTALQDEELVYVSKPGNYRIPVAGKVMHKCGCLSLDRENNREALKTVKQATEYINKDYASVVIYPEGTRTKGEKLKPFHAGSFKIAQKAGVPVVCTAVRNTENVQHNFPFRKTNVYIDILEVIDADFVKNHSTRETAELAQSIIQAKLDTEAAKEESGCDK